MGVRKNFQVITVETTKGVDCMGASVGYYRYYDLLRYKGQVI